MGKSKFYEHFNYNNIIDHDTKQRPEITCLQSTRSMDQYTQATLCTSTAVKQFITEMAKNPFHLETSSRPRRRLRKKRHPRPPPPPPPSIATEPPSRRNSTRDSRRSYFSRFSIGPSVISIASSPTTEYSWSSGSTRSYTWESYCRSLYMAEDPEDLCVAIPFPALEINTENLRPKNPVSRLPPKVHRTLDVKKARLLTKEGRVEEGKNIEEIGMAL